MSEQAEKLKASVRAKVDQRDELRRLHQRRRAPAEMDMLGRDPPGKRIGDQVDLAVKRIDIARAIGSSRAVTVVWQPQYQHIDRQNGRCR